MKKLIYFHGFGSSGEGSTVKTLRQLLPDWEVVAPDIPVDPAEALPFLKDLCENEKPDVIVGTSMGGMYAQQMRGFKRICVNPAFDIAHHEDILHEGTFTFFNARKNGETTFSITPEIIDHFVEMEAHQFDGLIGYDKTYVFGLFADNDNTVNCEKLFRQHYSNVIHFHGEHRLNRQVIQDILIPLILELPDQEYRWGEPFKPCYIFKWDRQRASFEENTFFVMDDLDWVPKEKITPVKFSHSLSCISVPALMKALDIDDLKMLPEVVKSRLGDYDLFEDFLKASHISYMHFFELPTAVRRQKRKRLFFDMDNVLVDFRSGLDRIDEETKAKYRAKGPGDKDRQDEIPGLFSKMDPMPGAIEAVHKLAEVYDVYILTTAPWKNPSAWSDKVLWVTKYFDDVFHKRIIITHRKDLVEGDYLVDDRGKNGTSEFKGEWIQFGSDRFPDWDTVVAYLLHKAISL